MKMCPVCRTTLFEDMEVCYGCLYRFGSEPALEKAARQLEEDPAKAGGGAIGAGDLRRWAVRLEVRSWSNPDQVWTAELIPPYEDGGAAALPMRARPDGGGPGPAPAAAAAVPEAAAAV